MHRITARIDKGIALIISGLLATLPLFFLPFTQDFYDTNKWIALLAITFLVLLLWSIKTVGEHTIYVRPSWAAAGFGALLVASLISVILASPNKMEALLAPYGPSMYLAFVVIFFLGQPTFGEKAKNWLRRLWYLTIGLLSLVAIYQFFGVGKTMFPNITFLASELWTPVGSTVSLIAVYILTLPFMIQDISKSVRKKDDVAMAMLFAILLITIAGVIVTSVKLIPVAKDSVLSLRDGWSMTLEVLKDPKRAIFGVGTENFLYAYTTGRPVSMNLGSQWNVRFTTNASLFMHITATLGVLGLVGLLIVIRGMLPKPVLSSGNIAKFLAVISIFLIPPTITLLVVYAVIILLTDTDHDKTVSITLPSKLRFISGIIAVVVVLLVLVSTYIVGKVYAAEVIFFRSLQALQRNDGMNTYNLQIQSATLAQFMSRYHLAYSQTNLAIANAIATNAQATTAEGQPITLSDQDRQTISSLIQQSIREAKIAVNLAPENVAAWENLAGLYQSLINVVADVDQWAIATYQRAIQLDPTNPSLRLGLGGVFLLREDSENAIQQFSNAINLKPDWANAHYNLAFAYKLRKDNLRAAYSLQQTLNYLPQASTDRTQVENELTEVRNQLTPAQIALLEGREPTAEETQGGGQLTRPNEEPLPVITPKLELPPDASPPAGVVEGEQTEAESTEQTESESTTETPQLGPEEANPTVQPQQ